MCVCVCVSRGERGGVFLPLTHSNTRAEMLLKITQRHEGLRVLSSPPFCCGTTQELSLSHTHTHTHTPNLSACLPPCASFSSCRPAEVNNTTRLHCSSYNHRSRLTQPGGCDVITPTHTRTQKRSIRCSLFMWKQSKMIWIHRW